MIHIRVINPVVAAVSGDNEQEMARLKLGTTSSTELSFHYVEGNPPAIESEYEDAIAVPGTVQAAIQAEQEGADAIVINCTADTGLEACRESVSIPVIGPTLASMHLAAELAHKFSVLTFLERTIPRFEEMAWRWGLGHKLASVRSVEIPILSAGQDSDKLARDLFEAGRRCVIEDGAHALILGCTAFEEVSAELSQMFEAAGLPVVLLEPYIVGLRQAEALVSMRTSHSKRTYPRPNALG